MDPNNSRRAVSTNLRVSEQWSQPFHESEDGLRPGGDGGGGGRDLLGVDAPLPQEGGHGRSLPLHWDALSGPEDVKEDIIFLSIISHHIKVAWYEFVIDL